MTTKPTQPFQPVAPEPGPTPEPDPVGAPMEPIGAPTEPVPPARPRAKSGAGGWINVLLGLAVAVAIGGVAFAAGRMTAPSAAAAFGRNVPGGFQGGGYFGRGYFGGPGDGQGGRGLFGAGGATVQGTVTAITADKITITTAGGQTVDIALDGSTTYHLESSAASGDVKTGGTVIVRLTLRQAGGTQTGPSAGDITIVP